MSPRPRLVHSGVLTACLLLLGCPTSNVAPDPSELVPIKTNASSVPSLGGALVGGVVTGPDGSPAAGAAVILTDARIIEVPNATGSTTGTDGSYHLKYVSPSSPWFVVATVAGKRMAGLVSPQLLKNNKENICNINVASTIAVAGITPSFSADPTAPTRVTYRLEDLSIDKFNDLVTAIQAAQPSIQPSAKLRDLYQPFVDFKTAHATVEDAYKALIAAADEASRTRLAGGSPTAPLPTPTPSAAATDKASTTTASPSPTPTGSATVAPSPSPSPSASASASASGLATVAAGVTVFTRGATTVAASVGMVSSGLRYILNLGTGTAVDSFPDTTTGGVPQTVTDYTVTTKYLSNAVSFDATGIAYYLVGNTVIKDGDTTGATITQLGASEATDLAVSADGKMAYVSSSAKHDIVAVDLTAKTSTVLAGTPGTAGSADGAVNVGQLRAPAGLCLFGNNLYVADKGNNALRTVSITNGSIFSFVGPTSNAAGFKDGKGSTASLSGPSDVATDATGNLYVADTGNNAIRKVLPDGTVTLVAGGNGPGDTDGAGTTGKLNAPTSIAVGNFFGHTGAIVTQTNFKVRVIGNATGSL